MRHRHALNRMPVAQVRQVAHLEFGIYLDNGTKLQYIDAIMRQQAQAQQGGRELVQGLVAQHALHANRRHTQVALIRNASREVRHRLLDTDSNMINPMARAQNLLGLVNHEIYKLEQLQLQLAHVALGLNTEVTPPTRHNLVQEVQWLIEELS